jgi:hypothetical protein
MALQNRGVTMRAVHIQLVCLHERTQNMFPGVSVMWSLTFWYCNDTRVTFIQQALVYVSTAYCNCKLGHVILEQVYPTTYDPNYVMELVQKSPAEIQNLTARWEIQDQASHRNSWHCERSSSLHIGFQHYQLAILFYCASIINCRPNHRFCMHYLPISNVMALGIALILFAYVLTCTSRSKMHLIPTLPSRISLKPVPTS